jgi:hypothetical protein
MRSHTHFLFAEIFVWEHLRAVLTDCKVRDTAAIHSVNLTMPTARSGGSFTFIQEAAIFIADKKQADQSAANNCSGLVPGSAGAGS